ncbi:DUF5130 family protein [Nakamurella panacisegetis]|nr:DUF5130 family protein [Nakamurella panacisegetis]
MKRADAGVVSPWHPPTVGPVGDAERPLDSKQLETLDEVISSAERVTGLRFAAFLGDLGSDSRATALTLLAGLGTDAANAVLVAISPGQRIVEVVTGTIAALRITDRAARLAVLNVISSATNGDLMGALTNGIRTLADQAGTLPDRSSW